MAWVFYTGFVGGFLVGFLVCWVGKSKPRPFAIIDADSVLRGQIDATTKRALVAETRIEKAKAALQDFPNDWNK